MRFYPVIRRILVQAASGAATAIFGESPKRGDATTNQLTLADGIGRTEGPVVKKLALTDTEQRSDAYRIPTITAAAPDGIGRGETVKPAVTSAEGMARQSRGNVSITYSTPGTYTFTVPANVTSLTYDLAGGNGGDGAANTQAGGHGARGGRSQGTISVTPGDVLQVNVGGIGGGGAGGTAGAGGYNGGGASQGGSAGGGGGGGASDIRTGAFAIADRQAVAGGGGGGGGGGVTAVGADGGAGGGTSGTVGGQGGGATGKAGGGGPGTATAVGAGGAAGTAGNAGLAGNGVTKVGGLGGGGSASGGGGGGGYWPGGGGGDAAVATNSGAGGGGGSSLGTTVTANFQSGDGRIILTYSGV